MAEPPLPCERDTVDPDGSFNRCAILAIAHARAAATRDLDVVIARYGAPMIPNPASVSFRNVRAWRRDLAARTDRSGLDLPPFRQLLAEEMARTWSTAQLLRRAMLRERALMAETAARATPPPACAATPSHPEAA
jgi:hypothetical protein